MESTNEEITAGAPLASSDNGVNAGTAAQPAAPESAPEEAAGPKPAAAPPKRAADMPIVPREPVEVSLRTLLQAGVHFGHQTSRWSPTMAPYIYGTRNGIHIIDLPKTLQCWEKARQCIIEVVSSGGSVLFVGTKKQAEEAVVEEARRCGAFYVSRRWLGGMLTNFQTIRKSISRMNRLEEILAEEEKAAKEGTPTRYTKKERLMMSRELEKLDYSLGGIREMYSPPQLMFVIDIKREDIAIKEAKRIDIPVIALVDTNCEPAAVSHPIPSNDDGTRAIRLFCSAVSDAVSEAKRSAPHRRDREPVVPLRRRGADAARAAEAARQAAEKEKTEEAPAAAPEVEAEKGD